MASIFNRGRKLLINIYDPIKGKAVQISTGLDNNAANRKHAKQIAIELQEEFDASIQSYKRKNLKRNSLISAKNHFMEINSNKSDKTKYDYKRLFNYVLPYFSEDATCFDINKTSVERLLGKINASEYSQNSKFNIVKTLKKFLSFLFEYNYTLRFTINKDLLPRQYIGPVNIFTRDELKKILAGLKKKNSNFRTLIYLLTYTGLRPSDVYNICVEDIILSENKLNYFSQKTGDYFTVPIHSKIKSILRTRMKEVGSGKILNYELNNIGKAFQRYLAELGLDDKKYNLRTFRKTFISLAYENGIDLATASQLVGHKKITTTQKYYTKFSIARHQEELKKFRI